MIFIHALATSQISQRSTNIHRGKPFNQWIHKGVMDIFGPRPDDNTVISTGDIVIIVNKDTAEILATGFVKDHNLSSVRVYNDEEHNQYRICLGDVRLIGGDIGGLEDIPHNFEILTKYTNVSHICYGKPIGDTVM